MQFSFTILLYYDVHPKRLSRVIKYLLLEVELSFLFLDVYLFPFDRLLIRLEETEDGVLCSYKNEEIDLAFLLLYCRVVKGYYNEEFKKNRKHLLGKLKSVLKNSVEELWEFIYFIEDNDVLSFNFQEFNLYLDRFIEKKMSCIFEDVLLEINGVFEQKDIVFELR